MRRLLKYLGILLLLLVAMIGAAAAIGMMLPASHEATRSARINAPPAAIYPLLITPEGYPAWRSDVERVDRMDADRFREHGSNGAIVFRIVDRQPPSRLVVAVDDPDQPFTGTWTFALEPESGQPGATRMRITERGAVPNPIFRAVAALFMSQTEGIEAYLRNLGRRFGHDVTIEP